MNFFKRKNPDFRKITPRQWAQRIRRALEKNALENLVTSSRDAHQGQELAAGRSVPISGRAGALANGRAGERSAFPPGGGREKSPTKLRHIYTSLKKIKYYYRGICILWFGGGLYPLPKEETAGPSPLQALDRLMPEPLGDDSIRQPSTRLLFSWLAPCSSLSCPLMIVRKRPIRVGAVVRTVDAYPYSLPEGLPHGVEVTVLSYNRQTYNHVVRDRDGREWTIKALQNLDAGSEYLLGARWLPGDHPLVLAEVMRKQAPA